MTHPLRLLALLLVFCSLSFAADSYIDAGFPAHDRAWTDADYTKAAALLQEKKLPLPSLKNEESSPFFWRMVNSLNFDRLQDKHIPVQTRFQTYQAFEKALITIFNTYHTEAENGTALITELDHLVATSLYLTRHAVLIVEELIPQIPKNGGYAKRMDALKKIRTNIAAQFSGVEESLDEKHASTDRSYVVLLTATNDSLREAKRALTAEARADLHRRFQKRHGEFQNFKSKMLLGSIVSELSPVSEVFQLPGKSRPSLWP
jgi:hypothetical protein